MPINHSIKTKWESVRRIKSHLSPRHLKTSKTSSTSKTQWTQPRKTLRKLNLLSFKIVMNPLLWMICKYRRTHHYLRTLSSRRWTKLSLLIRKTRTRTQVTSSFIDTRLKIMNPSKRIRTLMGNKSRSKIWCSRDPMLVMVEDRSPSRLLRPKLYKQRARGLSFSRI